MVIGKSGVYHSITNYSPLTSPPGGLLSVALSRALRPVDVIHHHVLWSPDFPPAEDFSGLIAPRVAEAKLAPRHHVRSSYLRPAIAQPATEPMNSTIQTGTMCDKFGVRS